MTEEATFRAFWDTSTTHCRVGLSIVDHALFDEQLCQRICLGEAGDEKLFKCNRYPLSAVDDPLNVFKLARRYAGIWWIEECRDYRNENKDRGATISS